MDPSLDVTSIVPPKSVTVKNLDSAKTNISLPDRPNGWHRHCSIDKYPPMATRPSPPTWSPFLFPRLFRPRKTPYNQLMHKLWMTTAITVFSLHASALQVMIDPGHGGVDSGTTHSGIHEKDLVLKVAGYLKTLLEDNPQFSVQMTRQKDQHLSLQERVKKAEKAQSDLFISLHANSNPDSRVKGTELYFQNSLPPDEESLMLADQENQTESATENKLHNNEAPSKKGDILAIVDDLHRQYRAKSSLKMTQLLATDWPHTAIRQAPFYVVSKTSMPSVLVEVGFLTHPEESKKLNTVKYQQEIAQKIYKAVLQYKEMMDKIEGQALE